MKLLNWTDENGFKRQCWVKDTDNIPDYGIPYNPPSMDSLGLDTDISRELYNALFDRKLFSYVDVLNSGNGVTSILRQLGLIKYRQQVLTLYKVDNRR